MNNFTFAFIIIIITLATAFGCFHIGVKVGESNKKKADAIEVIDSILEKIQKSPGGPLTPLTMEQFKDLQTLLAARKIIQNETN